MSDIPFNGFVKDLEKFKKYKTRRGDRRKVYVDPSLLKEDRRQEGDRRGH